MKLVKYSTIVIIKKVIFKRVTTLILPEYIFTEIMMMLNKFKKRISNNNNKLQFTMIKPVKYYFVIGSSQFLLKNEPLEEILRERAQFLKREKKPITFWLVKSPKFLKSSQLSNMRNKLFESGLSKVELTAIVSLDETSNHCSDLNKILSVIKSNYFNDCRSFNVLIIE